MSNDTHLCDKGGTNSPDLRLKNQEDNSEDQNSLTYAKAVGGAVENEYLKKYSEIIASQKRERNVLEIKLKKLKVPSNDTNEEGTAKNLSFDDISELIFEALGFQFEDCIGVDYYTGRYDTREVHLKANVDPSKYVIREPITFMNHEVTVAKMISDVVKVVFKNVPLYVPDEEILHLCQYYGTVVDNTVYKEQLRIVTSKKN